MIRWPEGLDPEAFLRDYWQKRPLFLPGGLEELPFELSPHELAGLACEPDVESRLVEGGDGRPWSLRHGPFAAGDFEALPETGWTLLVQDVEKHLPETASVLDAFSFLPRWRVDDVMVSYAVPGGGVGPHVDAYDVFLVQATGRRRWSIDPEPRDLALVEDAPLKRLRRFEASESRELAPGDVLYLPPGAAHHGLGDEPCMTVSVGFRAPSVAELSAALAVVLDRYRPERLYGDPDLAPDETVGARIGRTAAARARRLLRAEADEEAVAEALGRAATRLKPGLEPEVPVSGAEPDGVVRRLSEGWRLRRHGWSRFAWHEGDGIVWLFADGEAWRLGPEYAGLARRVCEASALGAACLAESPANAAAILAGLLDIGSLEWENGTDRGGEGR